MADQKIKSTGKDSPGGKVYILSHWDISQFTALIIISLICIVVKDAMSQTIRHSGN